MNEQYISPEELYRQLNTPESPTVVDVRGAEAYAAGHIPGALHIPADEVDARLAEIPRDRAVVPY